VNVYIYFNQRDQTYVCHELAKIWARAERFNRFGGCVVAKDGIHYEFLKTQTEVDYEVLDVVDQWEATALGLEVSQADVALWEDRLGCRLWDLVVADRQIGHSFVRGANFIATELTRHTSYKNICNLVGHTLNEFLVRFKSFRPDLIVMSNNPASLNSLAMVKVAEYLGIPYAIPHGSYVRDRMFIAMNNPFMESIEVTNSFHKLAEKDQYDLDQDHQEFFERLGSSSSKKPPWVDLLLSEKEKSRSMGKARFWMAVLREFLYASMENLRRKRQKNVADSLRLKLPFSNFLFWFRQQLSYRRSSEFESIDPSAGERYIVVPLGVNPEASTMVFAPDFVDPITLVEQIAINTPLSFKVYVTEHPAMLGRRPSGFYQRLREIPNVYIRGPIETNEKLVAGAVSMVLVSGTSGLEALAKGVHTVVLGKCFYSASGIAHSLPSYKDLHEILINEFQKISDDSKRSKRTESVKRLMYALQENSFPARSNLFWGAVRSPEDLSPEIRGEISKLAKAIEKSWLDLVTR